jgi:hypothetical protein
MRFKKRLFLILWLAGFAGVLSILLLDVKALVAVLPASVRADAPTITLPIMLLGLIQPTVLLSLAVLTGVALARKVGLSAPVAEAFATGEKLSSVFKPQIVPGIVGGVVGGGGVILAAMMWKPFFAPEVSGRITEFGKIVPMAMRLLYGGITEEVLIRWGLMTLLVWAGWRVFQKGRDKPKPAYFVGAIVTAAVVFGLGHLPVAFLLFPEPGLALVSYVVAANSIFGVIAGFLYWKKGLESSILAHMVAHVVMLTGTYLGAYF